MTGRVRKRPGRLPRALARVDLHAVGKRWVEDGHSLTALAREFGCAYTTLYGKLRELGYTLDTTVGARAGRRFGALRSAREAERARHAALIRAERRWADALGGQRFADARVPPPHGRAPRIATLVARNSSLADL